MHTASSDLARAVYEVYLLHTTYGIYLFFMLVIYVCLLDTKEGRIDLLTGIFGEMTVHEKRALTKGFAHEKYA